MDTDDSIGRKPEMKERRPLVRLQPVRDPRVAQALDRGEQLRVSKRQRQMVGQRYFQARGLA